MDDRELRWLAGLLEGEGSFCKPPPCDPNRPRILLAMTDEDVVQHVTKIFGMTYYHGSLRTGTIHRKKQYRVCLRGRSAVTLMKQLCPLMGLRRQQAIDDAIACHTPIATLPDRPQIEVDSERQAWCKAVEGQKLFLVEDENEFFWLAGLLEGEGSFFTPSCEPNQPRIQIMMTDEDVIARVTQIWQLGSYVTTRVNKEHMKPIHVASIRGHRAAQLMRQMQPLMSKRRQSQIDTALASYVYSEAYGSKHPNAKLHESDIREIRSRLNAGEELTALAREFGVDQGLIWQIRAGRIWRHVK